MERVKKLSIAYCKKILESEGENYSDEETEMIRDLLYKLGELDYLIVNEIRQSMGSVNIQTKAA